MAGAPLIRELTPEASAAAAASSSSERPKKSVFFDTVVRPVILTLQKWYIIVQGWLLLHTTDAWTPPEGDPRSHRLCGGHTPI
mmetsp:Transcript_16834/g.67936  ORF Transcript_16834/g.67936 Transcript_16834/m.67936 type:complete len:83 (+) Transcript_16834:517-765(+)